MEVDIRFDKSVVSEEGIGAFVDTWETTLKDCRMGG